MSDMMNPRRHGDRNGRNSEGEESENLFFEGDGSSSDEQPDRPRTLFAELIIWDIGDEEEEYPFVDNYQNFQEEENNVSFPGVVLGVEEESMPVYDTYIEDVIEKEERFVGKGGFGGEEDRIKDVVVVVDDLCSSMIQTTLSVDFERHGDRNGRKSEGEESENMFFEGDGSSSDEQPDRPRTLFAEPIIWDIGDEEEEYPFVNNY
ncbi:hypothetical protein Tco_0676019 [Tanacetum coccineum]